MIEIHESNKLIIFWLKSIELAVWSNSVLLKSKTSQNPLQ